MSLIISSLLTLSAVQVFGYDVRDLLQSRDSVNIKEIKEGDCLRGPEMQAFVGAENIDLYYTYDCGVSYPLKGDLDQSLACGLNTKSGDWSRTIVEHDMPGVFFPDSVPCMSSVTSLDYYNTKVSEVPENLACAIESTYKITERSESMTTKKYGIGQGDGYLPHPLFVKVIDYQPSVSGEIEMKSCKQSEFNAEYKGWGSFQIQWKKTNCLTNLVTECSVAKVTQSKNSEGKECALVKKITKCSSKDDLRFGPQNEDILDLMKNWSRP